jgi:hypothetical protein
MMSLDVMPLAAAMIPLNGLLGRGASKSQNRDSSYFPGKRCGLAIPRDSIPSTGDGMRLPLT